MKHKLVLLCTWLVIIVSQSSFAYTCSNKVEMQTWQRMEIERAVSQQGPKIVGARIYKKSHTVSPSRLYSQSRPMNSRRIHQRVHSVEVNKVYAPSRMIESARTPPRVHSVPVTREYTTNRIIKPTSIPQRVYAVERARLYSPSRQIEAARFSQLNRRVESARTIPRWVPRQPVKELACNGCGGYQSNNCGCDSCAALESRCSGNGWGGGYTCCPDTGPCGSCNCTDYGCGCNPCIRARTCCQVFGNIGAGDFDFPCDSA